MDCDGLGWNRIDNYLVAAEGRQTAAAQVLFVRALSVPVCVWNLDPRPRRAAVDRCAHRAEEERALTNSGPLAWLPLSLADCPQLARKSPQSSLKFARPAPKVRSPFSSGSLSCLLPAASRPHGSAGSSPKVRPLAHLHTRPTCSLALSKPPLASIQAAQMK